VREELTQMLLARRCRETDPGERRRIRDAVVLINLPLAEAIATRYRGMGVEWEDLSQVAKLGLIEAADRFDPVHGARFSTFATPTVSGEIKRYLRDRGWAIRPPRSMQEHRLSVNRCRLQLTQSLGHSPTIGEIAAALNMDQAIVAEVSSSWDHFRPLSLDKPVRPGSEITAGAMVGHDDPRLDHVDTHETLMVVLNRLSHDERLLLVLRFEDGLSQSQIAAKFGISQMQVSRRLHALLGRLREDLTPAPYHAAPHAPTVRASCAHRGRDTSASATPRSAPGRCGPGARTLRPAGPRIAAPHPRRAGRRLVDAAGEMAG
jgi:RNA polymerase sigma-B factor